LGCHVFDTRGSSGYEGCCSLAKHGVDVQCHGCFGYDGCKLGGVGILRCKGLKEVSKGRDRFTVSQVRSTGIIFQGQNFGSVLFG
jgi:hypothetical protein